MTLWEAWPHENASYRLTLAADTDSFTRNFGTKQDAYAQFYYNRGRETRRLADGLRAVAFGGVKGLSGPFSILKPLLGTL